MYKRHGLIEVADRKEGHMWAFSRVEYVERVKLTAEQQILKQGGKMTPDQELAYLGTLRDLNKKGIAWVDPTRLIQRCSRWASTRLIGGGRTACWTRRH